MLLPSVLQVITHLVDIVFLGRQRVWKSTIAYWDIMCFNGQGIPTGLSLFEGKHWFRFKSPTDLPKTRSELSLEDYFPYWTWPCWGLGNIVLYYSEHDCWMKTGWTMHDLSFLDLLLKSAIEKMFPINSMAYHSISPIKFINKSLNSGGKCM